MSFTNFSTPLGPLEIHFSPDTITKISFTETKDGSPETGKLPPVALLCMSELNNYFEGKNFSFSFSHVQAGSGFQHKVWNELLNVPAGKTMSYLQLSKKLLNPLAIRAVANANGKNNLAIVVPCHRIIGSDGSLTGYAGGLWRKKWLLQHEAKFINGTQTLF